MFSQTFPLRVAVIIIAICGVLAATPHATAQKAPSLIDVLIVPETSPVFPGMYCVASYSIMHNQIVDLKGIPRIVVDDMESRGVQLLEFLVPLAREWEQLTEDEFGGETLVLRNWILTHQDPLVWRDNLIKYDCKGMTEQWAVLKVPDDAPL